MKKLNSWHWYLFAGIEIVIGLAIVWLAVNPETHISDFGNHTMAVLIRLGAALLGSTLVCLNIDMLLSRNDK